MLIGVWGANFYARDGGGLFLTQDFDLFAPPDPVNELRLWRAAEKAGFDLFCGDEPLDRHRDRFLAERVVSQRALVRVTDGRGFDVELTLVMAGFTFESVEHARRWFTAEGVRVPVARLEHIVRSKAQAGRPKDRLFLATHEEVLRHLLERRRRSR